MAESYQPFLIADFKTGLELNREPWLLPRDAFTTLKNAYIYDGVLRKRKGFSEFANLGSGLPITGITSHVATDGTSQLIVTDTRRTYKYSAGTMVDIDLADVWSGDVSNKISSVNYLGNLYMANGKDQIRKYDGTTVSDYVVDITSDALNNLDFAIHIATSKERIIVFHTSENGIRHPQRARWSSASNTDDWTKDEFIDAPTSEWIVAFAPVGDDFIVWFEQSVWSFRYTGDSTLPFRWEKITSSNGATAYHTGVPFEDQAVALGKGGHIWSDSVHVQRIDQRIPDIVLSMNQDLLINSYGLFFEELNQIWAFYPTANATNNDEALILNFKEKTWAIYDNMDFNCAGNFKKNQTETWLTIGGTWLSQTEAWVSSAIQSGYPIILAGKDNGKIYQLNNLSSDDNSPVTLGIESARWNPFASAGQLARLGYIDFLITPVPGETLTIELFTDFNSSSYLSEDISLDGDGEKEWVRVFSGEVGESHRVRISQTSSNTPPRIHAIMPYFKPAGTIA